MNPATKLLKRLGEKARSARVEDFLSRRNLLLGAAAALGLGRDRAEAAPPPGNGLTWLVNRLTFGWTREEQQLADTLGYHGYLEYHLNHTAIDDSACQARVQPFFGLILTPAQLHNYNASYIQHHLIHTTILRSVYSKRQLYQRMVEFWSDHFSIDITKADIPWIKIVDDRDVVRPHALGKFRDMVLASTQSPSMLQYLDNAISYAGNQNENYARELMELHTLGVSGGYTQQDVVEVARCFTGWTVDLSNTASAYTFQYNSSWHDDGQKVVLGNVIPAGGGINDGLAVIDILVNHPSTANFIATKLCKRFYGYSPPTSLINSVAATYTATGGDIKAMLRTLFTSVEPATVPLKLKRPYHLFVSALRASQAEITGEPFVTASDLRLHLSAAGHEPFFWAPPDGYPDQLDAWSDLVLPRWNFMAALVSGEIEQASVNIDALFTGTATAQQVADRIDAILFGGRMNASDKTRIRDYLLPDAPSPQKKTEALALAMSTPGYQWY